ncbi:asparaginase [Basilea psittacipulmonis]|uniref:Asparaginase n=1 Tax=Basilea psittacipulmonis DSM 24701 TaxID=1072685 RepID=A0A077DG32_9BURK|nr:asparaginase [Basilea psittacipulmonis]AIL33131.1 hypothetical protein IX83_07325 [Basilea psittacipulmonis DSM 24701]
MGTKKTVALGTLGGTICMMPSDEKGGGVVPKLGAKDFLRAVPEIANYSKIVGTSLLSYPSAYLQFSDMLKVLTWCQEQVDKSADGIVLTQGTDTLEDSAFFLSLLWHSPVPIVMTGAMRSPNSPGADGAANLLASVIVASSDNSQDRGVQVVFADRVYEANWVEKAHTTHVAAFQSYIGHCGEVVEGRVHYFHAPVKRFVFPTPNKMDNPNIPIYEVSYSDDPKYLKQLLDSSDAVVIAGVGAGHISERFAEMISQADIPVVMTSRTRHGRVTEHTYGYVGAEVDLQARGVCYAHYLTPHRARMIMALSIANNLDPILHIKNFEQSMLY